MTLEEYLKDKFGAMAKADPNFKARYEDKRKSMSECIKYIMQEAQKQAVGKCAAVSDDDVLQMAVHYYQEEDVKPTKKPIEAKVVAAATTKEEKPKKTAVLIPNVKPKKTKETKEDPRQLSLF